jgi:hypothetical protein
VPQVLAGSVQSYAGFLPQSIRKILGVLENVEKVVVSSNMPRKRPPRITLRKPPKSVTKVSTRVLSPTTFEFPKRQKPAEQLLDKSVMAAVSLLISSRRSWNAS